MLNIKINLLSNIIGFLYKKFGLNRLVLFLNQKLDKYIYKAQLKLNQQCISSDEAISS